MTLSTKIISILFLLTISFINLNADPGHFGIFQIKYKGKLYYYENLAGGVIKSDLCYYDADGNYVGEVKNYLNQIFTNYLNNNSDITLYSNFDKINTTKLTYSNYGDGCIYNFYNPLKVKAKFLLGNYQLEEAYNVFSDMYTDPLNKIRKSDQKKINNGDYKEICIVPGIEAGEYYVYAEKNKYTKSEIVLLKNDLMMKRNDNYKFFNELIRLFDNGDIILCVCYE